MTELASTVVTAVAIVSAAAAVDHGVGVRFRGGRVVVEPAVVVEPPHAQLVVPRARDEPAAVGANVKRPDLGAVADDGLHAVLRRQLPHLD